MSVIFYNGITLPYGFMTRFDQEAIYEDSNTDWYLTKFDIAAQCLISKEYIPLLDSTLSVANHTTTDIMSIIRSKLLKPRKTLSVKFNGVDLIPQRPAGITGTVDDKNGPQPQRCTITQLTDTTFIITFHIIAHYWENNKTNSTSPAATNRVANPIVYNRWTETAEIDQSQYTRRIRDGRFAIRSNNKDGLTADFYRHFAVVGVPEGFIRENSQYVISPDGLSVQYRVVDKEVFIKPPSPAYEATGYYTETAVKLALWRRGEVQIRLRGKKDTPQQSLIQAAIGIVVQKLSSNITGATDKFYFLTWLEEAVMRINLFDNEVTFSARIILPPSKESDQITNYIQGIWGFDAARLAIQPIPLTPTATRAKPFTRGTAKLLLQAAAYYDPNLINLKVDQSTGQFDGDVKRVGEAGVEAEE